MAKPRQTEDGILIASKISVTSCEHGTVFIRLHDPDGNIFAAACMPSESALVFTDDVLTAVEKVDAGTALACDTVH
jgi:hypothetical protein